MYYVVNIIAATRNVPVMIFVAVTAMKLLCSDA